MSKLRDNDVLKLQLIELVKIYGNIARAAKELGLKPRQCQEFFAKEKQWMVDWWKQCDGKPFYDPKDVAFKRPHYTVKELSTGKPEHICRSYSEGEPPRKYSPAHQKIYDEVINKMSDEMLEVMMEWEERQVDNSRILLISDLHIPYHHPDSLAFLKHLKGKYNPTRVICLGDELDKHALSFHDSDPNLPSAGDELRMALPVIKQLKELFPVMDILESNHGSLLYRKAHHHGIPKEYLKTYNEVLQVDEGWKWHYEMTIDLPNGRECYLHHGKSANITKTSQAMSMCAVGGHYHNTFKIEYWANPLGLYWAMQCGCLIDDKSYAFNYNNVNLHRPLIGTGLIIDGLPVLEAMVLDKNGRWVGGK